MVFACFPGVVADARCISLPDLRLLDQDVAQVEHLTGFDGELLTELRAVRTTKWGAVDDVIGRAGIKAGNVIRPWASDTGSCP